MQKVWNKVICHGHQLINDMTWHHEQAARHSDPVIVSTCFFDVHRSQSKSDVLLAQHLCYAASSWGNIHDPVLASQKAAFNTSSLLLRAAEFDGTTRS